ncbi:MAG: 2,3-bisphosphoglycerate-independent phosphoglycerate mutase [Candidatus Roizmanbacteria bacterium]|nr:2,3-bisphosphoglycerate-independent phosphoglycerate mutase [Candidatus Roizmanbacteria bacterium]
MKRPVVLLILDGWGVAPPGPGNAISQAHTPHIDRLWRSYPHGILQASGEAVGLPQNEVGNTETGHLNMGAGHIVYQDLPRINMAIADGSFYKNEAFLQAINHVRTNKSTLHIMGLIGSGGVHANNEHLYALMRLCYEQRIEHVQFHLFTDGRDSLPTASPQFITAVEEELKMRPVGRIASIAGRYYAMDRDERWDRTGKVYNALTRGEAPTSPSAMEAITASHRQSITDEFIQPVLIAKAGEEKGLIKENDAVIFYNFRIDRPRQLTKAFVLEDFDELTSRSKSASRTFLTLFNKPKGAFTRGPKLKNLFFITMTEYEKHLPVTIAFPPEVVKFPLGRVFADRGMRQLRAAESEKERFVTFYFNGQREMPFVGEDHLIIQSQQIATYDKAPEMRTREITQGVIERIQQNSYDCVIVNFAAPDMVGHTGVLPAAITACSVADECIGKLDQVIAQVGGYLIITADHGNCEEMLNPQTKTANTEHSGNPVPCIIVGPELEGKPRELPSGKLGDIAPTILSIMEINLPVEMTGRNLLE